MRHFFRSTRGAALTEFSFSAVIFLMMLLTTVEFAVELFMRQSFDREAARATLHYAETRSKTQTDDWVAASVPGYLRGCFEPIEVHLFNHVQGNDLSGNSAGYKAQDNGGDLGATLARVTVSCTWTRVGPFMRSIFGEEAGFSTVTMMRMRD